MSVFTNPASAARESAAAYLRAVSSLLADRDPVDVLSRTPGLIRNAAARFTTEALEQAEAPGKWSVADVVHHLGDTELVWGYRLRRTLTEDAPVLRGYDQDRWAREFGYRDADISESYAQFEALRVVNLRLVRRASPQDMERTARHEERGAETLAEMLLWWAGHDLVHLRQIDRIRKAVHGGASDEPGGRNG